MLLAALNLNEKAWHLARVTLALWQPLLMLLVLSALVFATGYLLALIATHWGDRHTAFKTLFFSAVIHCSLAVGVVTLIPDYQIHAYTSPQQQQEALSDTVQVNVSGGGSASPESDLPGGTAELFSEAANLTSGSGTDVLERSRIAPMSEPALGSTALEKRSEFQPFVPTPSADVPFRPAELESLPEPTASQIESARLEPLASQLNLESLPTRQRSDVKTTANELQRSVPTSSTPTSTGIETAVKQPAQSSLESVASPPSDRTRSELSELSEMVLPSAELTRNPERELDRPADPDLLAPQPKQLAVLPARTEQAPQGNTGIGRTERSGSSNSLEQMSPIGRVTRKVPDALTPGNTMAERRSDDRPQLPRVEESPRVAPVVEGGIPGKAERRDPLLTQLLADSEGNGSPLLPSGRPSGIRVEGSKVQGLTGQYAIEIYVKERTGYVPRPGVVDGAGQPVVRLRDTEIYAIRMINHAPHEVAIDLRIDGVSCFAFGEGALRYWIVPPNESMTILGWHRSDSAVTEFKMVADAPQSAAAQLNLASAENYGFITAIIHSTWPAGAKPPDDEPMTSLDNLPRGKQATGFGNTLKVKTSAIEREIGAPRDVVSIRYD